MTFKFSVSAACVAVAAAVSAPAAASTFTPDIELVSGITFEKIPFGEAAPQIGFGSLMRQENFDGAATEGSSSGGPGSGAAGDTDAVARTAGNVFDSDANGAGVGVFRGLGGTGNGLSAIEGGTEIQIRKGNNFGRINVLDPGGNFLDSNDTEGFSWEFGNFDGLREAAAFITDPNDNGGLLRVDLEIDGDTVWGGSIADSVPGDSRWLLTADLTGIAGDWTSAKFIFTSAVNDGIGISNATLSAIPLPAPILMLLSGIGVLGGISWRKRQSA